MKDPTYKEVTNAEFVKMTRKEHIKLVERFGATNTSKAIEKLDNYKGSLGRKYKSDYRAILSWAMKAIMSSNGSTITHPSELKSIKGPHEIQEAQRKLREQGWRFEEVKINTGTAMKWVK